MIDRAVARTRIAGGKTRRRRSAAASCRALSVVSLSLDEARVQVFASGVRQALIKGDAALVRRSESYTQAPAEVGRASCGKAAPTRMAMISAVELRSVLGADAALQRGGSRRSMRPACERVKTVRASTRRSRSETRPLVLLRPPGSIRRPRKRDPSFQPTKK